MKVDNECCVGTTTPLLFRQNARLDIDYLTVCMARLKVSDKSRGLYGQASH